MNPLGRSLNEVPVAIIDFETTGFSPKAGARVVEVAVARVEPGRKPELVLDTLIDPQARVLCTSIHGISDDDVDGAPLFSDVADDIVRALEGSVVGAFNASFDMSFLAAEMGAFRRGSTLRVPPHLCMMWLRPLLGIGNRCSLSVACGELSLPATSHRAAEDALATGYLWERYVSVAQSKGIRTFQDLQGLGSHKYLASLAGSMFSAADVAQIGRESSRTALKPRLEPLAEIWREENAPRTEEPQDSGVSTREYWNALASAFADQAVTAEEIDWLRSEQQRLRLGMDAIRGVHARFVASQLVSAAEDDAVSSRESEALRELFGALHALGWAPGERATPA